MNKRNLLAVFIALSFLTLSGCPKKPIVAPDDNTPTAESSSSGPVTDEQINAGASDSDSGNAMGLQTIHFPYDSFEIVGENKDVLTNNIKILKGNATVNVQVEGHCDERGGVQYNLALGEKRANAVKQQLLAGGVSGSRITTISMGKEKPITTGTGEEVWARNRRANFVITSK